MDGAKGMTASASNVVNLGQLTGGTTGTLTLTLAASGSGKTIGTAYPGDRFEHELAGGQHQ